MVSHHVRDGIEMYTNMQIFYLFFTLKIKSTQQNMALQKNFFFFTHSKCFQLCNQCKTSYLKGESISLIFINIDYNFIRTKSFV